MTTVAPTFALEVPPGFIQVPVHAADPNDLTEEDVGQVRAQLQALFGDLAEDADEGLDMTTAALVAFGIAAAGANAQIAAAGLMRSPEAPRPVLVQLTALQIAAQQTSAAAAVAEVLSAQRARRGQSVRELTLPAGKAVHAVKDTTHTLPAGAEAQAVTNRESTLWLPDRTGATMAVISISSANTADWKHIEDLAMNVFESIEWEDLG